MAERVSEIMNREVLAFDADAPAAAALQLLLQMGVTAAPIVDSNDHPVGVVSLRDLIGIPSGARVVDQMRAPAIVILTSASLAQAAALLDELGLHHLVAVGPDGRIAGFVSTLDLIRGLTGAPARHPATFPHYDHGAEFSDDRRLDPEHVGRVPHAAGIVVLTSGGVGCAERIVGVETTSDVKDWLTRHFCDPAAVERRAGHALGGKALRFRYGVVDDGDRREAMAFSIREEAQHHMNTKSQAP